MGCQSSKYLPIWTSLANCVYAFPYERKSGCKTKTIKSFLSFAMYRNVSSARRSRVPPCGCFSQALFASLTATVAANAGFLLSVVLSAVDRCPLTELFTCKGWKHCNPFVCAILKATAKTSPGERCEWDSTLAIVQGTVMQTLIPVGTQCPGLWWKKYQLHRSKRVLSKNREEEGK